MLVSIKDQVKKTGRARTFFWQSAPCGHDTLRQYLPSREEEFVWLVPTHRERCYRNLSLSPAILSQILKRPRQVPCRHRSAITR